MRDSVLQTVLKSEGVPVNTDERSLLTWIAVKKGGIKKIAHTLGGNLHKAKYFPARHNQSDFKPGEESRGHF